MLEVGSFRAQTCGGVTRRSFLRAGASLPLAFGLNAAAAQQRGEGAKTKSVIFVWLWGAPSHLDTVDPKPGAPSGYRGPFTSIATRTPGVHFTELLPKLAARSDKFSLVRSNVTRDGAHPPAGTLGMTGYEELPSVRPSFGAIVARHRGGGRSLPPYLMLGRGVPRDIVRPAAGYGGGEWGKAYDPFLIRCSEMSQVDIPGLKIVDGLSPERLTDRRLLREQLDEINRRVPDEGFANLDRTEQQAFTLLTSRHAVRALDLSAEPEKVRAAYGQTSFGQSLLLARRLAEAGVPYIHVNWSEYVEALTPGTDFGWDTHIHNFEILPNRHCPIFDRAFSALLDDLHDRGLLASTLVVAMGEFGRTPKINKRASRDHWPQCYFSLWAGGGVKAGRVVGASDRLGEHPVTREVRPQDVGVTMMDLLGINSVVRAELKVLRDGKAIDELL